MHHLSVIICTHNPRDDYFRRVLDALKTQTLVKSDWELVLVDNASPQPLSDLYDLSWHPLARHIREETLGVSYARYRGISEATGKIFIFIDDDSVPESNYLEVALDIAREWPFIGSWGGNCVPEYEIPLPAWVPENAWRLTVLDVPRDTWSNLRDFRTSPVGAGMCFRREVGLHYLERWRTRPKMAELGRRGKGVAGYEDMDICHCALDLGLGTGLSTRLKLTHLIRASRITQDYLLRHAESDAASYVVFCALRGYPFEKTKPLTILFRLRWFCHRTINRVPRIVFEMQKAARRGHERGYREAMDYLDSVRASAASHS